MRRKDRRASKRQPSHWRQRGRMWNGMDEYDDCGDGGGDGE